MTESAASDTKPRVSIDAETWKALEALLVELPYRIAAPMADKIAKSGGVVPIP